MLAFLVLHLRPLRVPERNLRFAHTFGLGGMSLVLLFLLAATGVLLMLGYEATPETAYASIVNLERDMLFGAFVRSIHYWSANLLVAVGLCHLLRVFLTGGIYDGRQFNWVIGLGLLALILAANFTGYLLPWDQLSFWAVTICTSMLAYIPVIGEWLQTVSRGGPEVGGATLVLFYTLHTTIVPVLFVVLVSLHFWRIRKARGVVPARSLTDSEEEEAAKVTTYPHLLVRELAVLPHYQAPQILNNSTDYPLLLSTYQPLLNMENGSQNYPWAQEMYLVMHGMGWTNYAEMNSQTVQSLGINDGDRVWVESTNGRLKLTARVFEGVHPHVVSIASGQGHYACGRWAKDMGVNPNEIIGVDYDRLSGQSTFFNTRVRVYKA